MKRKFGLAMLALSVLTMFALNAVALDHYWFQKEADLKEVLKILNVGKGDELRYIKDSLFKTKKVIIKIVGFCIETNSVLVQKSKIGSHYQEYKGEKMLRAADLLEMASPKISSDFKIGENLTDGESNPGKLIGHYRNGDALIESTKGKWKRISTPYRLVDTVNVNEGNLVANEK